MYYWRGPLHNRDSFPTMDNFGLPDRLCEMDESELNNMLLLENACDEVFKTTPAASDELTDIMQLDDNDCDANFDSANLDMVSINHLTTAYSNFLGLVSY